MSEPDTFSRAESHEIENQHLARMVFAKCTEKLTHSKDPKTVEYFRKSVEKLQSLINAGADSIIAAVCNTIHDEIKNSINEDSDLALLIFAAVNDEDIDDDDEDTDDENDLDDDDDLGIDPVKAAAFQENQAAKVAAHAKHVAQLEKSIQQLVAAGEVDERVALLFLAQFKRRTAEISKNAYNVLVETDEEVSPEVYKEKNQGYKQAVKQLVENGHRKIRFKKEKNTYFFLAEGQTQEHCYRIYIGPKTGAEPGKMLQLLDEALNATGNGNLEYKLFGDLDKRNDQITFYLEEGQIDSFEKVVDYLQSKCPAEYFSDTNLPTGIPIAPGITFGVEPLELNRITNDGDENFTNFSYNMVISQALTMAYGFAYNDAHSKDAKADVSFGDLQPAAEKYFEQALKLAGINPETMMMQNVRDGKIPDWIQKRMEK